MIKGTASQLTITKARQKSGLSKHLARANIWSSFSSICPNHVYQTEIINKNGKLSANLFTRF